MAYNIENATIYFSKLRNNAKIPCGRDEDGWIDVFPCFDEEKIVIPPLSTKLIPTGIASAFPPEYRIGLYARGSNTKMRTVVNAGRIDSGYRGEYFVALVNTSLKRIEITKELNADDDVKMSLFKIKYPYGKAICQAAIEIKPIVEIKEIEYAELLKFESERGTGNLGSTDNKHRYDDAANGVLDVGLGSTDGK